MYKVDVENKLLTRLSAGTYSELRLRERFDIQEWIEKCPSILGEDLLIVAKERVLPSRGRLDLLAIDRDASLVIIELKRDDSGPSADWQAIKYASYCSAFTDEEIYETLADSRGVSKEAAKDLVKEFIGGTDLESLNQKQRIILASREFHSDVASAALWLIEQGIQIQCVRLEPFVDETGGIFINPTVIIPAPEARDYIQRKEIKQRGKALSREGGIFSREKSDLDDEELREALMESLSRPSSLTPRVLEFFRILLSEDRPFHRDEIKERLYSKGIGNSVGHAGTLLSNISQFVTKRANPHLRQVVEFDGGEENGMVKNNYWIVEEHRALVASVIRALEQMEAGQAA